MALLDEAAIFFFTLAVVRIDFCINLVVTKKKYIMEKQYVHPFTQQVISKEEFFKVMFGEEFMESNDKGALKEYTL